MTVTSRWAERTRPGIQTASKAAKTASWGTGSLGQATSEERITSDLGQRCRSPYTSAWAPETLLFFPVLSSYFFFLPTGFPGTTITKAASGHPSRQPSPAWSKSQRPKGRLLSPHWLHSLTLSFILSFFFFSLPHFFFLMFVCFCSRLAMFMTSGKAFILGTTGRTQFPQAPMPGGYCPHWVE